MSRSEYDYLDAAGEYVFTVVVERGDAGVKKAWQGIRAGDGSIVPGLNGLLEPPLYRLPELTAHLAAGRLDAIYAVEGEKDVEALRALGHTATTNPMGAGKWRVWHSDALIGARHVVVVADADEPGRAHARAVHRELDRVAGDVELVTVPADLGEHADVFDLIAAGRSLDELVELAPEAEPKASGERAVPRTRLVPLASVRPRAVRELVPGQIEVGNLNLVAGVGGLNKSTYLMGVAARLTRGELTGEPASVILVRYEDAAAEVLRPRVEAAQGDLDRVFTVDVDVEDGGIVVLPRDLRELERHVAEVEARLVVIDPIVAAIDSSLDAYKDQDVRTLLARLALLADEAECAIVMVGHLNKSPSSDAYLRIANSAAFYNASRSVVLFTPDPDDPEMQRLVTQVKQNNRRLNPVQRHRIEEILLDERDHVTGECIETIRLVYVEDAEDVDRSSVLADRRAGESKAGEAVEFLKGALADGQWHDSAGLKVLAPCSPPTLKRAAQELGVEYDSRGFPRSTWWRLPQSVQAYPTQSEPTDGTGDNPHG